MRRPVRTRSVRPPKARRQALPASLRDRLAMLLALVTVACLALAFFLSKDTQFRQFLMPGPLASAHGAIENCNACHTKSGSGKLTWLHGLVAGDPLADSKACLTCHKMPDTAFNAHTVSADVLEQSTKRLMKIAAEMPAPPSARAQSIAFPTDDKIATRPLLRDLPPGASGRQFQAEQDLQRAMRLLPRGEVRQLRRPSPGIRELSVQEALADHLRPRRPFRQTLP